MDETAKEYKFCKATDEEYWEWIFEKVPWRKFDPFNPKEYFVFFNPISRALTTIPINQMSRNLLYLPTNSPNTGEHFIPVIFAVNGRYEINYDECENRLDDTFQYKSENHSTRIDIFVCRQPDYKKDKGSK